MSVPQWVWPVVLGAALVFAGGFTAWVVNSINDLKTALAEQRTQLAPLSFLIEKSLMGLLHHEEKGYEEADTLIDEYMKHPDDFPPDKRARLEQICRQRAVADVPELEQERAKALLSFMKIVVIEKKTAADKAADAILGLIVGTALMSFRYWHRTP